MTRPGCCLRVQRQQLGWLQWGGSWLVVLASQPQPALGGGQRQPHEQQRSGQRGWVPPTCFAVVSEQQPAAWPQHIEQPAAGVGWRLRGPW